MRPAGEFQGLGGRSRNLNQTPALGGGGGEALSPRFLAKAIGARIERVSVAKEVN